MLPIAVTSPKGIAGRVLKLSLLAEARSLAVETFRLKMKVIGTMVRLQAGPRLSSIEIQDKSEGRGARLQWSLKSLALSPQSNHSQAITTKVLRPHFTEPEPSRTQPTRCRQVSQISVTARRAFALMRSQVASKSTCASTTRKESASQRSKQASRRSEIRLRSTVES